MAINVRLGGGGEGGKGPMVLIVEGPQPHSKLGGLSLSSFKVLMILTLLSMVDLAVGFTSSSTPASSMGPKPPEASLEAFLCSDHPSCLRTHLLLSFLESFPLCFILTPDVQMFCSVWGLCPLFFVLLLCPFPLHGVIMLTIMCNARSFHWFIYRNFSGPFFCV